MYKIIQRRKIYLSISIALCAASIIALSLWGLKFGIDFTGGSLLEVQFSSAKSVTEIQDKLQDLNLSSLTIQPTANNRAIVRFQDTSEETHQNTIKKLKELDSSLGELRFDSVGPSIGQELKSKAFNSIVLALLVIIIYIAFAFKKISKPVASWKYGVAGVVALFHDVLITVGVFSVLGHFYGWEVNSTFVAAILTILGYSINDTIIVFDRTRENLPKSEEDFENTVNRSVNQTLTRSINTSFTVLLALLAILIFGGASLRDFALALCVGIAFGTYSSIFIASPIVTIWEKHRQRSR
jgi:preprotein translocase subunit SecF